MKSLRKPFIILCVLAFILSACYAWGAEPETESTAQSSTALMVIPQPVTGECPLEGISKYGNMAISITCEDFLAAGYQYGDVVTVVLEDQSFDLPFVSNYSDVDSGEAMLTARKDDTYIMLAINMGDFATTHGLAVKSTAEDETVSWSYPEGVEGPLAVTISMKEPGGYYAMYVAHQLSYTDERSDYPDLTDEQFANFRNIEFGETGKGILYRTASPVNPEHNRNTYADEAIKEAGVTVILNLADDETTLKSYEGYEDTYYSTVSHLALNMGVDFTAPDMQAKLEKGFRYMAENPGVYAIHCTEGKDRAGLVSALLECLMGATYDEVMADYMVTYYNYYGITPDDDRYQLLYQGNIEKTLCRLFGTDDLKSADLASCAAEYIKSCGLSDEELGQLRANLKADKQ